MKKITELAAEQIAQFGPWVKKWVDIGLSTEPADFDRATEAALKAYTLCNLKRPMVVLRMGSPYAATIGGALACVMLRELFGSQVRSQVESQVRSQVGSQVRSQVWSQVESQVRSQVRSQVESQGFKEAADGINNYRMGSLWASWGAYITFFRDVCGWSASILERFKIDEALIRSVGWIWWHENVLALSDRPQSIKRDDWGRLHCENGPSIEYRDGWALYHWHGVSIPGAWVTGNKPSAKEALTWENIEQRRAACEIIGWQNILHELNAKVLDADDDPQIGSLLEVSLPDSGKERFLQVKCGTGRDFAIPVPREITTAIEAQAWTYGLDKMDFIRPEVRT